MAQDREQDRMGCKQPETPLLCVNNCGFFGCPTTKNLCSKCYKALVLKEESRVSVKALGEKKGLALPALSEETLNTDAISAITSTIDAKKVDLVSTSSLPSDTDSSISLPVTCSAAATCIVKRTESSEEAAKEQEPADAPAPQKLSTGSTRCLSCRKRVGLLGFKCRCGGVFCSTHRYSDTHACTFDYKSAGRDAIAKANPLVKADKVERI